MPDRLKEIRARLDAATPGPWDVDEWTTTADVFASGAKSEPTVAHRVRMSDADFIAHAPADIAWLLDEVERLRIARGSVDEHSGAPNDHLCAVDDSVVHGVTKRERP